MKRQNLIILGGVAVLAAIIAIVASNAVFGTPQSKPIKVPVVNNINSSFPDVQHDPAYTSFLNGQALDPTQLIQSGGGNPTPFQGGTQ